MRILCLVGACALAACGGSDSSDDGGGAGAVWPSDAMKLVATDSGGGHVPQPPAGSECALSEATYTLTVAGRALNWMFCVAGATASDPYKKQTGARALSEAEYAQAQVALSALKVVTQAGCGADKSLRKVFVTTPRGEFEYVDSFYFCQGGGKTYVDNIDGVFTALNQLSH
jgi:hypothetical protein